MKLQIPAPSDAGIFYLGFITNPKNGRVKALSEACLDRTYLDVDPFSKNERYNIILTMIAFSKVLNIQELYNYAKLVKENSEKMMLELSFEQTKSKIPEEKKNI